MPRVTLIRHGQTNWNLEGRIQGGTDIELNETGRRQAREAAADLTISGTVYLAASDLARARETAAIIGAERGWGEPRTFPGLRERNYGVAEGMLTDDFAREFGPWPTAVVPDAETQVQLATRMAEAVVAVAAEADAHDPDAHVVAVSHGGAIGALIRHLSPELERFSVANGEAHTFEVSADGLRYLVTTS